MRNLTAEDAVQVSEHIHLACRAAPVLQHERLEFWLNDIYSLEPVRKALTANQWVGVYEKDALVGTGYFVSSEGYVGGIYVHPNFQGQGLGTLILTELVTRMVIADEVKAVMSVHADNVGMRKAAERLNFTFESKDPNLDYFPDQNWVLLSRYIH